MAKCEGPQKPLLPSAHAKESGGKLFFRAKRIILNHEVPERGKNWIGGLEKGAPSNLRAFIISSKSLTVNPPIINVVREKLLKF